MAEQQDKLQAQEGDIVQPKAKKESAPKSVLTDKDKRAINLKVLNTETDVMNPIEYEQMRKIANDMHAAGSLPSSYSNPQQVFMAIQLGRQMGFAPHEAVLNGYYVDGRYNIWGKAVPSALRRHGWRWKFEHPTSDTVTIKMINTKTGEEIEDEYSYEDAKLSGFTTDRSGREKFGWKQGANRKRKLRYGILSQVLHTYLPDVLGGVVGIAEYSEDYIEGEEVSSVADDNKKAIADKVANFGKTPELKDTKPKAVDTQEAA